MKTVAEWVAAYAAEGWSVLPIPAGSKAPQVKGWEQKSFGPKDFTPDSNIGVHLGKRDATAPGLYDVDLDHPWAAKAADLLLPATGRVSGRPGKPRSHRFYYSPDAIGLTPYVGLEGMLVELRGTNQKGALTQTVIPPSVHTSGEQIAWDQHGPVATVPADHLSKCVKLVAMAVMIAQHFPPAGQRHPARLALAGYLVRTPLDPAEVKALGHTVMVLIDGDTHDWDLVCRDTFAKHTSGTATTGGRALASCLVQGDQVLLKLNAWLGRTTQAKIDEAVELLNQQYFIVEAGTSVVVAEDRSDAEEILLWPFHEFRKKHSKEFAVTGSKKGGATKRPLADLWIEHPDGRRYRSLVYAPPGAGVVHARDYNAWRGFRVLPERGSWSRLETHLFEVVCQADEGLYAWVLNWCAALLQRPGTPAQTALVLRGGQGVGKGTFIHDTLGALFDHRHYACIVNRDHIYGRFNSLLSGRVLVFLDEATWGGSKAEAGVLKGLVTSPILTIERKSLPAVAERSMLHLAIASNEDWPVGVDPDDRRFTVLDVQNPLKNDRRYFEPLYAELHRGGRAAFLFDMLRWSVQDAWLRMPPATAAKQELKQRSLSVEAEWWLEKLQEGQILPGRGWLLQVDTSELYLDYLRVLRDTAVTRRSTEIRLSRAITRFCPSIKNERRRTSNAGERRHFYLLPDLAVARKEFENYAGVFDWTEDAELDATDEDLPF